LLAVQVTQTFPEFPGGDRMEAQPMNKRLAAIAALGLLVSACGPDAPEKQDLQPQADQPQANQPRANQPRANQIAPAQPGQRPADNAGANNLEPGEVPPLPLPDGSTLRTGGQETHIEAVAELAATRDNQAHGTIAFVTEGGGELAVSGAIDGLKPGKHGFHIHEVGDCSAPDATSAGGHFAPNGNPHGAPDSNAGKHHAGDLGNIVADDNGHAAVELTSGDIALSGDQSIVGRAVVVHSGADDLTTQPSGDAGAPVACGKITYKYPQLSRSPSNGPGIRDDDAVPSDAANAPSPSPKTET